MFHRHPFLSLVTGAYLAFVGWLTLTPRPLGNEALVWRVLNALHRRGYAEWLDFNRLEFLANIGLFVPVGMFLLLLFGTRQWWLAGAASFALTLFIETVQRDIPGRVSDPRDVLANTAGGLIGVVVATVLTLPATIARSRQRTRRRAMAG